MILAVLFYNVRQKFVHTVIYGNNLINYEFECDVFNLFICFKMVANYIIISHLYCFQTIMADRNIEKNLQIYVHKLK